MPKSKTNQMVNPNILITGTPGVGKTSLSKKLAEKLKFKWLDVSQIAKDNEFIDSYDNEYECPVLDEDKVLDFLEPIIAQGGNIVEYHGCDFFPERWFQVVYVITCDNTVLYDRLNERKYNENKIKSNIQCEIFQTILEEANDSYDKEIVHVLKGDTEKDLEANMKTVQSWYKSWKRK